MNWSYIAGFIDGDGSISIRNHNGKPSSITISITNVNKTVLVEIKKYTKCGSIYTQNRNPEKWKTQYVWYIRNHKKCKKILENIKPYLIIKSKKCEMALNHINNTRWRGDFLSKKEIESVDNLSLRNAGKRLKVSHETIRRYRKKYK